jgi:serine/threonine protein kinase
VPNRSCTLSNTRKQTYQTSSFSRINVFSPVFTAMSTSGSTTSREIFLDVHVANKKYRRLDDGIDSLQQNDPRDEPQALLRAQDDLDVAKTPAQCSFDVNRSYSNDGRLALDPNNVRRETLQSLPVCGPSNSSIPKRKRISTMWRFRKEMIIGSGADGKVFLAHDLTSNERIAVKEILISPSSNRTLIEAQEDAKKIGLMKRQIDCLRGLPAHPNVVRHLGAERTTCALHVMMEYVAGGSISALLSKLGPFSEKVVRIYTRHICEALAFLHSHGVIHRDIKGANCLVGVDGTAKVCDFGCSVMKNKTGAMGVQKGIHGTSMWMSPECIQSEKEITEKTDIWSLGCTVVEMATGKAPWYEAHFTNEWAAMFHISQCGRGPPIPSHLSRQAHEFLAQCFQIDSGARMSAEEILKHPFLTEEFDASSNRAEMLPPTPSDCNIPFLPSHPWSRELSSTSEMEASNYSSFTPGKGAVYDQEWGDAETAIDDEVISPLADELDASMESDSRKMEVSLEVIGTFLRGNHVARSSPPPTESTHSDVAEELAARELDDEFGLGLPEPILFNVFSFLDAPALCMVACVTSTLAEMSIKGAKEVLWKSLFIRTFGEVDPVQQVLRKNWKNYFRNSYLSQNVIVDDRFKIVRQRGQSERVYDGVDINTQESVVLKIERWSTFTSQPHASRFQRVCMSGGNGPNLTGTMSTTFRAPSPSRDQHSGGTRLPTLLRTPTKQKPQPARHPAPAPPPTAFSPSKSDRRSDEILPEQRIQLIVGGGQRPPLGRPNGITSPPKQRPHLASLSQIPQQPQPPNAPALSPQLAGQGGFSRSRPLPRNTRLPSPSQYAIPPQVTARRTSSPYYRDGAVPPTHFVFLQPSALFRVDSAEEQISPDRSGENVGRMTESSHHSVVRAPEGTNAITPFSGTMVRDSLVSSRGGWHEIYDFQRTSDLAPLVTAKQSQKSLLQHDYRFIRHLEALGARCIPRLLAYHDSDTNLHRNALVTSSLGPSLNELLLFCGNQLTLRTLSLLTIRLLDALEEIHNRDVVHGNISPTNIVMGSLTGDDHDKVFIINFAHARFFRDPRTHRPTNTSTSSANAERAQKHNEFLSFCSTFVQRRCTAAPRDDIIALGYVLCYLFHGGLPWTRDKTLNVAELLRQKNAYFETLQRTPPIQLHYFLKSGYALRQGEIPDYRYLKSLVQRMMEEKRWSDDGTFDWSTQLNAPVT